MFSALKPEEQAFLQGLQDEKVKMQKEMATMQAMMEQMGGGAMGGGAKGYGKGGRGGRGNGIGKVILEHRPNSSPGYLIW